ncbi:uncharacterized protein LOC131648691 [Vicia villosa]|uniref:uncharacterized protein LOC131648691 n=1 Tax=Vicia villosa TaxID=3911 RepID=UPI00273C6751|nr:uncharacterized protein LOC131648691 [Vicia villosa]
MDIMKAYDSVDWNVMQTILVEVGFPRRFIKWVMLAVTSVSYQFNINGVISKSMKATRGSSSQPPTGFLLPLFLKFSNRTSLNTIRESLAVTAAITLYRTPENNLSQLPATHPSVTPLLYRIALRDSHV